MSEENIQIKAARKVYETYWDSYLKGDIETFSSMLDDNFEMIGTSESEVAHDKAEGITFFKSQMMEMGGKVEMRNRQISAKPMNGMLLINEHCDIYVLGENEWNFYSKIRISTFLHETESGWKVIQQHGSLPDMRVQEGETLAIEKISRENIELRDAVKRRTAELESKNRELAIEAALEKVRAVAMGMKKPEDMLDVCRVISDQLQQFGVEKTRNVQTAIIDENIGRYLCYQYFTPYDKKAVEITEYLKSPVERGMVRQMLASRDGYFIGRLSGKELEDFRIHRKEENHFPDPLLDKATALDYCFLSIGEGGLGLTLYQQLEEGVLTLFRRFHQVFSLAYTRFLDLQKAEAQAREAQIEAALERVRAQTMAMHNSEDVGKCVVKMFSELTALGVDEGTRFGIGILNHDNENNQLWTARKTGEEVNMHIGNIDMAWHPMLKKARQAWLEQVPFHKYVLEEEDLLNYYQMLNNAPDYKIQIPIEKLPKKEIQHCFIFEHGFFYAFSPEEFDPEIIRIAQRFSSQFEQTYRRYLDLQKAEAQAREAQIQLSLERIRSKAMSMQNSDELSDFLTVLFEQFTLLDLKPVFCHLSLLDLENNRMTYRMTGSKGARLFSSGQIDLDISSVWYNKIQELKSGRPREVDLMYFPSEIIPEISSHVKEMLGNPPENELPQFEDFPDGQFVVEGYCKYGYLGYSVSKPPSEEDKEITRRIASEFGNVYQRFLDLQKAEAQALEATKRASVDRVRAEIASMRTTSDLERIQPLIWNELKILGVPFIRCGVFIMEEAKQEVQAFLSKPEGASIAAFRLPYYSTEQSKEIVSHWQKKQSYKDHMDEAAFAEFIRNLVEQGAMANTEKYVTENRPTDLYLHFLPFLQGMLYVGNDAPLKDEELQLVQNLAEAFSTAYARYEDFNKLELAKSAVEAAMSELKATQAQLIQSEKMASLGELTAGIAHEIQNPLNFVNNFSEVSAELVDEIQEERAKNQEARDETLVSEILGDIKLNLEKINHHGKRADAIVKGMLEHSRTSTGEKVPTDINALADEYLRLSYHGMRAKDKSFNADFSTDFDTNLPKANVIPQDIGRVLLNIINNGFQATNEPYKGSEPLEGFKPIVKVSTKNLGDKIEISVKDNGPGIPDDIKEKIFQPFFTTKPTGQGTGLGLSLAYDIVKAHRGEIKVQSLPLRQTGPPPKGQEEFGTKFLIELPIV